MVKEWNTNTSRRVYMLCDFSRAVPPEIFEREEDRLARERAEKEAEKLHKKKNRHVRLKTALHAEEKAAARQNKMVAKRKKRRLEGGMSGVGVGDASMIDELIRDTAAPVGITAAVKNSAVMHKMKDRLQRIAAEKAAEEKVVQVAAEKRNAEANKNTRMVTYDYSR